MCDVDQEAVVAAADAPSHLRHPQGAAPRGPRRLRRTPARPAVPRRRLDPLGRAAARGAPPEGRGHRRAGRQVHRPARRLPLGRRGAAGRRLRPRGRGRTPLGRLRRVRHARGARPSCSATSTRSACPAASASAGIEGKLGALRYAREHGIPTLGPVPRPAVHGDRVRPQRRRPGGRGLHRVRPRRPAAGDRDDGGAEVHRRRRRRPRRHDAARALPGRAGRRLDRPAAVRRAAGSRSATGTATR